MAQPRLLYSVVWEDAFVACEALRSTALQGKLLCIASAGDIALSLLTLDTDQVLAVDCNAAQIAATELRACAIAHLSNIDVREFLGASGGNESSRLDTYATLRSSLSPFSRSFWDYRRHAVKKGIIHGGRFERYLRRFRRWLLPLLTRPTAISSLIAAPSQSAREAVFASLWNTTRWRVACRLFFGAIAQNRFRFPNALRAAAVDIDSEVERRTRHVLTTRTIANNPYLSYLLLGYYPADALPLYLRDHTLHIIRARLSRLHLHHCTIADISDAGISGMYLSDIFEPLTQVEFERDYAILLDRLRPGGRLVYWCNYAIRQPPPLGIVVESSEVARLMVADQIGSYPELHIESKAIPRAMPLRLR